MMNGEIWWIDFSEPFGSEPGFCRPGIIVQNDKLNQSGINTYVVVPLTTNLRLEEYEGNVFLNSEENNLPKDSVAICPLITSVDKERIDTYIGKLSQPVIEEVQNAIYWVTNHNS